VVGYFNERDPFAGQPLCDDQWASVPTGPNASIDRPGPRRTIVGDDDLVRFGRKTGSK